MYRCCLVVWVGVVLSFASSGSGAAIFRVDGPAAGANPRADAWLRQVEFDGGVTVEAANVIFPSAVTDLHFAGSPGEFRVVSGPDTTGTSGFQRIEALDGDAGSVSTEDQRLFGQHVAAAFQNTNLNNYLDLIPSFRDFGFEIRFDRPIVDNDPGADAVGEILYFERGMIGSNSKALLSVGMNGQVVGRSFVTDPVGRDGPKPTAPATVVATYDAEGNVNGSQQVEAMALDLSEVFGVTAITSLFVSGTPQPPDVVDGEDGAPDLKILALSAEVIPEPASALAGLVPLMLLAGRRRISRR